MHSRLGRYLGEISGCEYDGVPHPVSRLVIPSARLISVASPKWKIVSRWRKLASDGAAGAKRPLRRIICLKGQIDMTCTNAPSQNSQATICIS